MTFEIGSIIASGASGFSRVETDVCGIIDAPIEAVWNLFTDWSGIHKWFKAPTAPKDVVRSDLLPGQTETMLPRTRMIEFGGPDAAEPPVPETLLHTDAHTRTLYYRVEGIRPSGYRDYLCYVSMDATTDGGTALRINARMTAPTDRAELVRTAITAVHRDGIIANFRRYLAAQQ